MLSVLCVVGVVVGFGFLVVGVSVDRVVHYILGKLPHSWGE